MKLIDKDDLVELRQKVQDRSMCDEEFYVDNIDFK